MSLIDRPVRAVDESGIPGQLPRRWHLSAEELDAAVAAQLERRAEQGFGNVPPMVLVRVAQIVTKVRWDMATAETPRPLDDQAALRRAA